MQMTAANILTLSRIVLVPVFLAFFYLEQFGVAFVVFCVAGLTDLIDGTVARMLHQPSQSGALLDPVADKVLLQSCFLSLTIAGVLPWWFFGLAFLRDAMIIGGITYLESRRAALPYRATLVSKSATLFQLAVSVFGLLAIWRPGLSVAGSPIVDLLFLTMAVAAILIVVSGIDYVFLGLRILRRYRAERASS